MAGVIFQEVWHNKGASMGENAHHIMDYVILNGDGGYSVRRHDNDFLYFARLVCAGGDLLVVGTPRTVVQDLERAKRETTKTIIPSTSVLPWVNKALVAAEEAYSQGKREGIDQYRLHVMWKKVCEIQDHRKDILVGRVAWKKEFGLMPLGGDVENKGITGSVA